MQRDLLCTLKSYEIGLVIGFVILIQFYAIFYDFYIIILGFSVYYYKFLCFNDASVWEGGKYILWLGEGSH